MLTRRELIVQGAVAAAAAMVGPRLLAQAVPQPAPARRPNVLLIYTDDQNPDTIGCYGSPVLTPSVDRLAKEGVRFTRSYVTSSVCTPSRYCCLTGRYASRCDGAGFVATFPGDAQANVSFNTNIEPGNANLATMLRDAGYYTGFVGKWHTGVPKLVKIPEDAKMADPATSAALKQNHDALCEYIRQCGFDQARNVYRGNVDDHKLKDLDTHNPEWLTQGVLDFLGSRDRSKPFFMWYCPTLQHSPYPTGSLRKGDWRKTPAGLLTEPLNSQPSRESVLQRANAAKLPKPELAAAALWLDDSVAAILKRLEESGDLENTLVLYMSDNCTQSGKGTCYDNGANTPFVAWWKGHFQPGTVNDDLVQNLDLTPTILEACGVKVPAGVTLNGRSLLPLLAGQKQGWRDAVLLEIGHTRAVTDGRWKYLALRYPPAMQQKIADGTLGRKPYHMDVSLNLQEAAEKGHPCYWDADQLYDLAADPREQKNLASDPAHAQTLARMKGKLGELLKPLGRKFGEFV